jgi:putative ABC transport system substrate-binding protein
VRRIDKSERRRLLLGLGGFVASYSVPLYAHAQARTRVPLIGFLDAGERLTWWEAFKRGMSDLGYVEGKSVRYEMRFAHDEHSRLLAFANELVRLNPDAIVTASAEATDAAREVTNHIPIVTGSGSDPVSRGFAKSLAQPGGNVTGLTSVNSDLMAKRVELLRELLPKMKRLAVLWQSNSSGSSISFRELDTATRNLGLSLHNIGIRKREEIPDAFASAVREHASAVIVIGGPLTTDESVQIASLARKHQLPTMGSNFELIAAGGLMAYGVDFRYSFGRAAYYVDRILKGAKAGELPIEQPSRFELALNKGTAKLLGITIPEHLLLRADRIIE